MPPVVVGLLGKQGSGKDTFVKSVREILPEKSIEHIKSGAVLVSILEKLALPISRQNLQVLAQSLKNTFGPNVISRSIFEKIVNSKADIIIFDAVRWKSDEEMLRQFPRSILIYIDTIQEIRYQRLKNRKEKEDEDQLSRQQFELSEIASTEIEIDKIRMRADSVLYNNGARADFYKEIRYFCERFRL